MAYNLEYYNRHTKRFDKITKIERKDDAERVCKKCTFPARITSEFGTAIYHNAAAVYYDLDRPRTSNTVPVAVRVEARP